MTEFEKTYQNYNPRQAALDEARALLTAAAKAAMADGTLPEAELPAFIVGDPRRREERRHRLQPGHGRCPYLAQGPSNDPQRPCWPTCPT